MTDQSASELEREVERALAEIAARQDCAGREFVVSFGAGTATVVERTKAPRKSPRSGKGMPWNGAIRELGKRGPGGKSE